MKIHCQIPNNSELIDLEVDEINSSIEDLKGMIYDKYGVPINNQIIELENKRLPCKFDKKKLNKLNIDEESNIRIVYSLDGGCGCGVDLCCCGGSCKCTIM